MPSQGNQQLIEREVRSLKDESQRFTKQTQAWMTAVDDFKNEVNVRARLFFFHLEQLVWYLACRGMNRGQSQEVARGRGRDPPGGGLEPVAGAGS